MDWEGIVRPKIIELLNYLGYPWPTTDPNALRTIGSDWSSFTARASTYLADLQAAVSHIDRNNEGIATSTALAFLNGPDSNLSALKGLVEAGPMIAGAYGLAADVVVALRLAVIGEILLDTIQIGMAILTGGASAAVSLLVKQGAGEVIDYLIDKAISQIIGG